MRSLQYYASPKAQQMAEETLRVTLYYEMALFITKIDTTEANFSFSDPVYLDLRQLCRNADNGD